MNYLKCIAMILLIIGGLNWGLVGLVDFNLVTAILGQFPLVVRIIYILVGISALYGIYMLWCKCSGKTCG